MTELTKKLQEGKVNTGAVDKNGEALHQFDIVEFEGEKLMILWSGISKEYVAQSEEGEWIGFENLHLTEKVNNVQLQTASHLAALGEIGEMMEVANETNTGI